MSRVIFNSYTYDGPLFETESSSNNFCEVVVHGTLLQLIVPTEIEVQLLPSQFLRLEDSLNRYRGMTLSPATISSMQGRLTQDIQSMLSDNTERRARENIYRREYPSQPSSSGSGSDIITPVAYTYISQNSSSFSVDQNIANPRIRYDSQTQEYNVEVDLNPQYENDLTERPSDLLEPERLVRVNLEITRNYIGQSASKTKEKMSTKQLLTFDDISIVPKYSEIISRSEGTSLENTVGDFKFTTPVIASNMPTICGEEMAIEMAQLGGLGVIHRFMSLSDQIAISERWRNNRSLRDKPICHSVGSILSGSGDSEKERIVHLIEQELVDILCIDIAHGHSIHMKKTLEFIRQEMKFEGPVIAGNIVTDAAAKDLMDWGATVLKVGVGPGSACTTRVKTGVGVPQVAAIIAVAAAVSDKKRERPSSFGDVKIIADGGIREPGDAAKALAAGAQFCMIGGMLAGTDKTPGWANAQNEDELDYAGNASSFTKSNFGQVDKNYEGVHVKVPRQHTGSTERVIQNICEGIRSMMSYTNCKTIDEVNLNTELVVVTSAGKQEGLPHALFRK